MRVLHVLPLANEAPDVVALCQVHDRKPGRDLRLRDDRTHAVTGALERQPHGGARGEGVVEVLEIPSVAPGRGEAVDRDHPVARLHPLRGRVALRAHPEDVTGIADHPHVPAVLDVGGALRERQRDREERFAIGLRGGDPGLCRIEDRRQREAVEGRVVVILPEVLLDRAQHQPIPLAIEVGHLLADGGTGQADQAEETQRAGATHNRPPGSQGSPSNLARGPTRRQGRAPGQVVLPGEASQPAARCFARSIRARHHPQLGMRLAGRHGAASRQYGIFD